MITSAYFNNHLASVALQRTGRRERNIDSTLFIRYAYIASRLSLVAKVASTSPRICFVLFLNKFERE